jgi:cyclopropane fatty-acyl-phospholipid synthase-like methyltransferase
MTDLFPASEFDDWAETYDASVAIDQFPFYGYREVLEKAVTLTGARPGLRVLDLGTGTGNLAVRFARLGCELWCTDFSAPMLDQACQKLPTAHFCLHDLRSEWPAELPGRFDRIVSAYVFHHFEFEENVRIVRGLVSEHLAPGGRLVIADIAFPDSSAQEVLKKQFGDEWEEEYYWIADEALPAFEQVELKVKYVQVSLCAGIFTFQA